MDEGLRILELARNARSLFERQEPRQKRRLLNFGLSNCTWEDGEIVATFREPFDLLAETSANAARSAVAKNPYDKTKNEIWLPGPDSNQRDQPVNSPGGLVLGSGKKICLPAA